MLIVIYRTERYVINKDKSFSSCILIIVESWFLEPSPCNITPDISRTTRDFNSRPQSSSLLRVVKKSSESLGSRIAKGWQNGDVLTALLTGQSEALVPTATNFSWRFELPRKKIYGWAPLIWTQLCWIPHYFALKAISLGFAFVFSVIYYRLQAISNSVILNSPLFRTTVIVFPFA